MKHADSYTRQTVVTAYELLQVARTRTKSKTLKDRLSRAIAVLAEDQEISDHDLSREEMVATTAEVLE